VVSLHDSIIAAVLHCVKLAGVPRGSGKYASISGVLPRSIRIEQLDCSVVSDYFLHFEMSHVL